MKQIISAILILLASQAHAADWEESPEIGELFKSAGTNGTFVLHDAAASRYIGHNKKRARTRFAPASTFKIPNTLIGLATGAVGSVDDVLPYRGHPQPLIKEWKRDMGLRDAIALSNVPIYQELARRIGIERMRDNLSKMDYGNKETGDSVDTFWLAGPLRISAIEQTRFLAGLAQDALPFPPAFQKSVREIVKLEQGESWTLYGKTGWENAPGQGVGWWVGWVEKEGRIYAFALNMDMKKASDAGKRMELGKASLKALGLL